MPRLSIDITTEQHQHLKAVAALNGQSIKEFVLSRTFDDPDMGDEDAMQALKQLLAPRIRAAEEGRFSKRDADGIIAEAKRRKRAG